MKKNIYEKREVFIYISQKNEVIFDELVYCDLDNNVLKYIVGC